MAEAMPTDFAECVLLAVTATVIVLAKAMLGTVMAEATLFWFAVRRL